MGPARATVRIPACETTLSHRSATVWCRRSSVVADPGTVQALTSLAMGPKQRLNVLPAVDMSSSVSVWGELRMPLS